MTYQVALLNFEGPLDLLLQLVEGAKLEITTISLAEVTDQYLRHLAELNLHDPAELNQFVELATRLTYIKSLALLPTTESASDDEVQALREELGEYQRYKQAAGYLDTLTQFGPRSHRRSATPELPLSSLAPGDVSLERLSQAFADVVSRLPAVAENGIGESITLEDMMDRLSSYVTTEPQPLRPFLEALSDRTELIVAFLAILELVKSADLSVSQSGQFGAMMVSK